MVTRFQASAHSGFFCLMFLLFLGGLLARAPVLYLRVCIITMCFHCIVVAGVMGIFACDVACRFGTRFGSGCYNVSCVMSRCLTRLFRLCNRRCLVEPTRVEGEQVQ